MRSTSSVVQLAFPAVKNLPPIALGPVSVAASASLVLCSGAGAVFPLSSVDVWMMTTTTMR